MKKVCIKEEDILKDWEKCDITFEFTVPSENMKYTLDINKEEETTESRLAKYWASEEMTYTILDNDPDCYMDDFGGRIYSFEYKGFLSQLLKKEWFRS